MEVEVVRASITSATLGRAGKGPVTRTWRGIGSRRKVHAGRRGQDPAHGPAAFTTTPASIAPSRVSTPRTRPPAVRTPSTPTPSSISAPARRARVAYPWVSPDGSAMPSLGRTSRRPAHRCDPGAKLDRLLGRQDLGLDAQRRVQPVGGQEVAPQLLAADQEQIAVLHDVERQPVLLREPRDHRHARLGQANVDRARELEAEPPAHAPVDPAAR